jgi:diacylglycerol O-acyltransferase
MSSQLGAQDAQFLYMQAGEVLTHVMSICIFGPPRRHRLGFEDIVRRVAERSVLAPVYRRRLHRLPGDLDLPYWIEDSEADPARHVHRARLPRPGSWTQLRRIAALRFAEPMDLDRPLWDMLVVEGLDAVPWVEPGSWALLLRLHHAGIDGASGARALAALCDRDPRGTPVVSRAPRSAQVATERLPGAPLVAARALASGLTAPARVLKAVLRRSPGIVAGAVAGSAAGSRPRGPPPVTAFNARISRRRSFAATRLPLAELRRIRAVAPGATVNDVILAICAGALRSYLAKHGDLPAGPLSAVVPIDARPRGRDTDPVGNDVTAMSVGLATDVADPVARLTAIRNCTREAKAGRSGVGTRLLAEVGRELPGVALPVLVRLLGREQIARSQANLVITNVPSTPGPLWMLGSRLTHQFGMGPLAHGLGLFLSANTYDGVVALCITSDPELVPDPVFLCRCNDRSFRQLRRAAS